MKKTLWLVMFLMTLFFINTTSVFAAFSSNNIQVSCIYGDGKVILRGYDNFLQTSYATISEYPTVNFYKLNYNVTSYRLFSNDELDTKNTLVASYINYSCPNQVLRWLVNEYNSESDVRLNNLVYAFSTDGVYGVLSSDPRSGWSQFWGTNGQLVPEVIDLTEANDGRVSDIVPLVAERISITNSGSEAKSCSFVHKSEQASGTDSYIDLSYYEDARDVLFVSNGQDLTTSTMTDTIRDALKDATCDTSIPCLCVNESKKETNSAEGTNEYIFSRPRHEISEGYYASRNGNSTCTCTSGVSYEYHSDSGSGSSSSSVTQVCATIPATAKVLARIIKWAQILVPAFVLIFTAVDIGKIVIAGNVEEELPKRRKGIIIRFIVMVCFLFLPLFIKILFSTIFDDNFLGVGGIDCLFKVDLIGD